MSNPFRFCYHCGSDELKDRSWRQRQCGACGYHQFVTPTPAAVAVVLDGQGRLLLMRRAHEPGLGKLGLPGGIVEPWETVEKAASRELAEETGLQVAPWVWSYLGTFSNRYHFQGYDWPALDIAMLARVEEVRGLSAVDGEAQEVLLVPLAEVVAEELAFVTHTEIVQALRGRVG
jgi:ADP-ribose pyrophosphatase YjhB (NUDIX family)